MNEYIQNHIDQQVAEFKADLVSQGKTWSGDIDVYWISFFGRVISAAVAKGVRKEKGGKNNG